MGGLFNESAPATGLFQDCRLSEAVFEMQMRASMPPWLCWPQPTLRLCSCILMFLALQGLYRLHCSWVGRRGERAFGIAGAPTFLHCSFILTVSLASSYYGLYTGAPALQHNSARPPRLSFKRLVKDKYLISACRLHHQGPGMLHQLNTGK